MNCNYLIGIKMDNRVANAQKFQEALTKNGCSIKTRLGMHEVDEETCANYGIIVPPALRRQGGGRAAGQRFERAGRRHGEISGFELKNSRAQSNRFAV